jgi:tripartite-type tricarboxylate transporter receptor subunit TctC
MPTAAHAACRRRRRRRSIVQSGASATAAALGGVAAPIESLAQGGTGWTPRQPIRVLVGFAPGGAADIVARIAAEAIQRRAGHAVVVENRTGALGFIALQTVARAAPDGHTVGIGIMGSMAVAPVVPGSAIPFDLDAELAAVCNLAGTPMALIARPDAPFSTLAEFVAWARQRPGQASYASTGNGSTNQLAAEHLAREAGLSLLHVSYRGGAPAGMDLMAGRVDIFFGNVAEFAGMIRQGQVKALGLASMRPSAMVPDLPLLTREYPALDIANWFGLMGPAGLPAEVLAGVGRLFTEAMTDPVTARALAERGLDPIVEIGPAFAARIRADRERWRRVVVASNIRAD